jgi:hypothetical protein
MYDNEYGASMYKSIEYELLVAYGLLVPMSEIQSDRERQVSTAQTLFHRYKGGVFKVVWHPGN